MIILTREKYNEICLFIKKYKGLSMDCEVELCKQFPDVPALTLGRFTIVYLFLLLLIINPSILSSIQAVYCQRKNRLEYEKCMES